MCGIIAYTGNRGATPILLDGLANLEYRGYDSSGIAVISEDGDVIMRKSAGKLERLMLLMDGDLPNGYTGIGHTRWATHGNPIDSNAHPHVDCLDEIAVVHNGIVENWSELKLALEKEGHIFKSETDSEVIPHMIESLMCKGLNVHEATRLAALRLSGSHAAVVMYKSDPNSLISFRIGYAGGIAVGYGETEMFLASDLPAIMAHTRKVAFLGSSEIVSISPDQVIYSSLDGNPINKIPKNVSFDQISTSKGRFEHFMLKEIYEQPESIVSTMRGRILFDPYEINLEGLPFSKHDIASIRRTIFTGMGTSFHACLVARHMMERLGGIQAESESSSELRYRNPILDPHTLVVAVGQSGETVDTLSAIEETAKKGARVISVCNVEDSQASRLSEGNILLRAGPEIGVASTKTFVCSLLALYILSSYLGYNRGFLPIETLQRNLLELSRLPHLIGNLTENQDQYIRLAELYHEKTNFLYMGRGINHPIALEGALKLKEISYIHAEGCSAGEMKHGPIALIDETMPVVAIVPNDELRDKMVNNISEVKARAGTVIAIASEDDKEIADLVDHVIWIPQASYLLNPILASIPLQLLAYHIAVKRGCDIDKPRNLAKTVTVE